MEEVNSCKLLGEIYLYTRFQPDLCEIPDRNWQRIPQGPRRLTQSALQHGSIVTSSNEARPCRAGEYYNLVVQQYSQKLSAYMVNRSLIPGNNPILKVVLRSFSFDRILASLQLTVSSNMPRIFLQCNNVSQAQGRALYVRDLANLQIPNLQAV